MKKHKSVKKWVLPALCAAALIAAGVFVWQNPHYVYVFKEYIGTNTIETALTLTKPSNLVQVTLDELKDGRNITFDQSLMLINTQYPLPQDFDPQLSQYRDTELQMNAAIVNAYEELTKAVTARTQSSLLITSAYRSQQEQEEEYKADPSTATKPGASEHQAGLALDLCVKYHAGFAFLKTKAGQFVNSYCWQYGFVIRYPIFGRGQTGIKYEPWHIRYVGQPHAKILYNNRLTLEEYILSLEEGVWYQTEGYLISRQKLSQSGTLEMVDGGFDTVISPDNTGRYIVTIKTA